MQFEIGTEMAVRGRDFLCVEIRPHTRRDGKETKLAVWKSRCAVCGEEFTCLSPARAGVFSPRINCEKHAGTRRPRNG